MSRWRTVVVENRSKLDLKINNICVRNQNGIKLINISEIDNLILESTAISITAALLCELVKQKIKVIFCDETHNPLFELMPYYNSYDTVTRIKNQFLWIEEAKQNIWEKIVYEKIKNQLNLLEKYNKQESGLLKNYLGTIQTDDLTNREGHAAKVYFNALFGKEFTRNQENSINSALNYGYQILLSQFSKEITANGYLTQIGIHHKNPHNAFNLCSDLMEPFRPIVDEICYIEKFEKFEIQEKRQMQQILAKQVKFDNENYHLSDAIKIYARSIFAALDKNDPSIIRAFDEL